MRITTKDVRRLCARHTDREPCAICQLHVDITQAHHVLSLSLVRDIVSLGISFPEPETVWLCPNCHTYMHKALGGCAPPDEYGLDEIIRYEHLLAITETQLCAAYQKIASLQIAPFENSEDARSNLLSSVINVNRSKPNSPMYKSE